MTTMDDMKESTKRLYKARVSWEGEFYFVCQEGKQDEEAETLANDFIQDAYVEDEAWVTAGSKPVGSAHNAVWDRDALIYGGEDKPLGYWLDREKECEVSEEFKRRQQSLPLGDE